MRHQKTKQEAQLSTPEKQEYKAKTNAAEHFKQKSAAETAAGVGGSASTDSTEDSWSAKFSCSLGDDTLTVTREYMLVNGFENDETLAEVEALADIVEALSTTQ